MLTVGLLFQGTMGAEEFFDITEDNYKFTGDADLAKFAEDELRETESLRASSLQQLRECIQKHPDIKKCRTGMNQCLTTFFLQYRNNSTKITIFRLEEVAKTIFFFSRSFVQKLFEGFHTLIHHLVHLVG